MKMLSFAAAVLLTATGTTFAQQNSFVLQTKGSPAGKCVYTFDKSKDGFKVNSRYQARIAAQVRASDSDNVPAGTTTELQQTHIYKLNADYAYLGGSVMDGVTQINNGYSPNKQGSVMQLSSVQGGIQGTSSELNLMPGYIVLPTYDASAIQSLLYQATTHPSKDSTYFLIVPATQQSGRGGGNRPQSVQAKWVPQPGAKGTLADKALTLHHFSFSFGKNIYNVYADENNLLMETDIKGLDASYIRTGFALDAGTVPAK